jgi:TRAP transporter TAXI family solute receptor
VRRRAGARRLGVVLVALGAAACGGQAGGPVRYLSIATGGTGGVYYPYGGGLAKILSESVPGVQATAEVTAASVDNLKLLRDGRADLAFTLADTLADAAAGRGAFAGAPVAARAVAVLYTNYTHLVTREGSGIARVTDLRGRVVSIGAPGSGTEVIARRILEAAGLDADRDLRPHRLGASESADALKDGKVDAFFWSGGVPSPAIQDLAHTPGVRLRLVGQAELVPELQRRYGPDLYTVIAIPASAYPGVAEAVPVVGVANVLVASERLEADLVYAITRVLFERQADLAAIHPEAKKLTLETAAAGSPVPWHPGAERYYRERGVWRR